MKINLKEFRKRVEFINEKKHPTLDLIIWNYSHKCQFAKAWDEYTMMARGLITDFKGNIVARPFKKFFNIGESTEKLPAGNPIIYPKFDGSLGIQYYDGRNVRIATRGSFESDQAKWATEWIQKQNFRKNNFRLDKTYLYEIIYPENRIVVDYKGEQMLVLLAVIDTETGKEDPQLFEQEAQTYGLHAAKHISYNDLEKVISEIDPDEEGYVLHWPETGLRLKAKGKEYVRLHCLLTQVSSKSIWELLKNNQPLDEVIERVPDEFYQWVKETAWKLNHAFEIQKKLAEMAYDMIVKLNLPSRKEQAWEILRCYKSYSGLVFGLLDGNDVSQKVWAMVKPKYERPFKQDIDA